MLLPLLQGLSERQARLFLMLAAVTSRHQAEALQKLVDEDIAQAAGALASTLETAATRHRLRASAGVAASPRA